MTKEQRRIACAEELGWTLQKFIDCDNWRWCFDYGGREVWACGHYGHSKEGAISCLINPESSLNDCKSLIEMANKSGAEVDIIFERDGWCKVRIVEDGLAYIVETKPPESAIVEAFLKWRRRI